MENVLYEVKNKIGYITLNRPEKRNALSHELVHGLLTRFNEAEQDEAVRVVVLRANGEAFCAGADLSYLQQLQNFSYEENLNDSLNLKRLFERIYLLKKPVIAQVQGHALAGGCGLATVCDFIFSVPEAKFGYTEVKIGFIPALVMVFLIRKIGEQKARHLLLGGDLIGAEKAQEFGLINFVIPRQELDKAVEELAGKLIKNNSPQSMSAVKQMISEVQNLTLEEGLQYAAEMNAKARATEDCKKGISAFLNKSTIEW